MNKVEFPNIDIKYGRFLAPVFNEYAKSKMVEQEPDWVPPSLEEVRNRILGQKESWTQIEKEILQGMQNFTNLTFAESRIPVYIVPAKKDSFSDPIVISSGLEGDRFVDLLTHELVHRLLSFNDQDVYVMSSLRYLFPEVETDLELIHVLVHAVHAHIYLEVLNDNQRLLHDIERCQSKLEYKQSWEIVQREGYDVIMEKVQKHWKQEIM